jgi:diguanylate cyclase (GGDEF)-like protein
MDPVSRLNRSQARATIAPGIVLRLSDAGHLLGSSSVELTVSRRIANIVLRTVGRTLRRNAGGHAYRYGGEEFCLVFEGARSRGTVEGCERARQAIAELRMAIPTQPKRVRRDAKVKRDHSIEVGVTVSIGCAARGADRRAASEVQRAADQALYKAKAKGRNRVVTA